MADRGHGRNAGCPVLTAAESDVAEGKTKEKALTQRTQRNAERHRETRKRENVVYE